MEFLKAHGSQNDFVVLVDPDCAIDLTARVIQGLCHRRQGIGADGVIRVCRTDKARAALGETGDEVSQNIPDNLWFMDYRNADGSAAEMCGNGARVFVHVLAHENLISSAPHSGSIGTRAGVKTYHLLAFDHENADVEISMGQVTCDGLSTAQWHDTVYAGLAVNVGNPHLACIVPRLTQESLSALDFSQAPAIDHEFFPEGANIELATALADGEVWMRVYERGCGETLSCGTGTVATAFAALADQGLEKDEVTVHVRGGDLVVRLEDQAAYLRGPSRIVARGDVI